MSEQKETPTSDFRRPNKHPVSRCHHPKCTKRLQRSILFRYECQGCKDHYCEIHLDWLNGHVCPGLEMLFLRNKRRLEACMPTVKHKMIEPIG